MKSSTTGNRGVMSAALNVLSRKQVSTGQMRRLLSRKGYASDEIENCIAKLGEWRYLDDRSYAADLVLTMVGTCPFGRRRALFELKKRLFPADIVEAAVSEAYDTLDEEVLAHQAAAVYLRGKDESSLKVKERLTRWLLRRGFDFETANSVAVGPGEWRFQ